MARGLTSTSGWALMLVLLAFLLGPVLPWGVRQEAVGTTLRFGFEFLWQGEPGAWALLFIGFAATCFLVATQPLDRETPVWRSLVIATFGSLFIGFVLVGMNDLDRRNLISHPHVGPFFVGAIGAGLVLIAAIEIRLRLTRRWRDLLRLNEPTEIPPSEPADFDSEKGESKFKKRSEWEP